MTCRLVPARGASQAAGPAGSRARSRRQDYRAASHAARMTTTTKDTTAKIVYRVIADLLWG
jgi:hypothetical protein